MHCADKTRRLFFALWPSQVVRQRIIETMSAISLPKKGRTTQAANLHVTLHYLGPVTADVQACMHKAAQTVAAPAFELTLDRLGCFPRAGILWMGCSQQPAELSLLYKNLAMAITPCGYQIGPRFYSAHVTLMRKYRPVQISHADFSIRWPVHEFVLVESISEQSGVSYQVVEKYPLSCDSIKMS